MRSPVTYTLLTQAKIHLTRPPGPRSLQKRPARGQPRPRETRSLAIEATGVTARVYLSWSPLFPLTSPVPLPPSRQRRALYSSVGWSRSVVASLTPSHLVQQRPAPKPPPVSAPTPSPQRTLVVGWGRPQRWHWRRQHRLVGAVVLPGSGGGAPPCFRHRGHPVGPRAHDLDNRRCAQRVGPRTSITARVLARVKSGACVARRGARRVGVNTPTRSHRCRRGGRGSDGSGDGKDGHNGGTEEAHGGKGGRMDGGEKGDKQGGKRGASQGGGRRKLREEGGSRLGDGGRGGSGGAGRQEGGAGVPVRWSTGLP